MFETKDYVGLAEPIGASEAVTAFSTRDNLLGNHPVSNIHTPFGLCFVINLLHHTNKFVAWHNNRVDVGRTEVVTPELGGSIKTFHVTGTNADGFDSDEGLPRAGHRNLNVLKAVVLRTIVHYGFHRS
jgi:hypothetical protein